MRKPGSVISVIIMLLTIAFIAVPSPAAASMSAAEPGLWEVFAEGVTGEVVHMANITTTPREWYQLKADGIKVDGPTKLCHPFKEGRFGWTGEIFQLVEGAWVKLATTVGWVPDTEGSYKACAQAPAAGTYALFAYFDKAKAPVVECKYDTSTWELHTWFNSGGTYFYAFVDDLPEGTFVSYVLVGMSPTGSFTGTGAVSGSGIVGNYADDYVDFDDVNVVINGSADYAKLKISAAGCTQVLSFYIENES